ncbi:quinone oxidoreductase family protein [Algiphilus sp.]|uniref:quinone oxidoreductase family protein n=1 Tax=Algiphilus sp. TaxID=1872431 RepID=UPI003B516677
MSLVISQNGIGSPAVFEALDAEPPVPGPGEVRLRQTAVGVNYLDTYFRSGSKAPPALPFVNGFEAAGIVESVGTGVEAFAKGDRVAYNLAMGAYRVHRTVRADRLVRIPERISDVQAASMMLKGTTAEALVHRVHQVRAGDVILVHAAAGGLGSMLTQWASKLGATVIGTAGSDEKAERAKQRGAEHVIVYRSEDFVARVNEITDGRGVDVVYDGVGAATFHRSFDCLAIMGKNVLVGWASGEASPLDVHGLNAKSHTVINPSIGHYTATPELLRQSALTVFEAVAQGALTIEPAHTYALEDVAQAHRDLEARRTVGPIVLTTDPH